MISIYNIVPEKFIIKIPYVFACLLQTLFATVLPYIYPKLPQDMVLTYLGITPENLISLNFLGLL